MVSYFSFYFSRVLKVAVQTMTLRNLSLWFLVLVCLASLPTSFGDGYDYNDGDDNQGANGDDADNQGGNGDDAAQQYSNVDDAAQQYGDDYIKYWTDYALLPKRCIV
jgi:hypothetical protein